MVSNLSHLETMEEPRLTKKITEWNSIDFRPRGRPKMRLEDDVVRDTKFIKI
jgi:hypothetical protein